MQTKTYTNLYDAITGCLRSKWRRTALKRMQRMGGWCRVSATVEEVAKKLKVPVEQVKQALMDGPVQASGGTMIYLRGDRIDYDIRYP